MNTSSSSHTNTPPFFSRTSEQTDRPRILVAEDNADMRQGLRGILKESFEVDLVTDGKKALQNISVQPPDLVIADVMMPQLDGLSLLKQLRANPQTAFIPVILLSALGEENHRIEGWEGGADDYLVKPFSARELLARITTHLKRAKKRKEIFETEKNHQMQLTQLADAMPQIVWSALPDGTIDYYNKRWYDYTGLREKNQAWSSILHPDDEKACGEKWSTALQTGEAYEIEYRLRDQRTQAYRWFLGRALPVKNEQGQIVRWYGTCTDIHDRKVAEEKLKETAELLTKSNKELERFAYTASHDLQEPLCTIASFASFFETRYKTLLDKEGTELLGYLTQGAKRAQQLIRDLLSYSRLAQQNTQREKVSAEEILENVLSDLRSKIEETQAQLTTGPLPDLFIHKAQAAQLFQNLLSNALKFGRKEQPLQIHLSAEKKNQHWIFSVRDNGIGIEPKHHEQIFALFNRLHSAHEYPGSGMGLAICKKIVENHGGKIWVESDPQKGSTFYFTLPAQD